LPWNVALVTGASSGIGEAFADVLASTGVDLILVGRNDVALCAVASRARSKGVRVEALQADLSTEVGLARVIETIRTSNPMVDLLVNNAGLGQWGLFADLPLQRAIESMRVNNDSLVRLTHAALGPMLQNHRGCVIHISSIAAAGPGPQQAVYAATKAFISSFGQALSAELVDTGVSCTTVLPGYTRTNYFSRIGLRPNIPDSDWMSPESVVRFALQSANGGVPLAIPGGKNRLRVEVATPFPSLTIGRSKRRIRLCVGAARRVVHR
jgi:short-subunit dehydrogenase